MQVLSNFSYTRFVVFRSLYYDIQKTYINYKETGKKKTKKKKNVVYKIFISVTVTGAFNGFATTTTTEEKRTPPLYFLHCLSTDERPIKITFLATANLLRTKHAGLISLKRSLYTYIYVCLIFFFSDIPISFFAKHIVYNFSKSLLVQNWNTTALTGRLPQLRWSFSFCIHVSHGAVEIYFNNSFLSETRQVE